LAHINTHRYILIHTNQKGLFNGVCREVENFYRLVLRFEKEVVRGRREEGQDGVVPAAGNDVLDSRRGVSNAEARWRERPATGVNDDVMRSRRHELYIQKSVVDEFTRKILQGEMRFLPLATSIIIHMTLMLHVRYYAAVGTYTLPLTHACCSTSRHTRTYRASRAHAVNRADLCHVAYEQQDKRNWVTSRQRCWSSC
jgi:hypothetical protein